LIPDSAGFSITPALTVSGAERPIGFALASFCRKTRKLLI
jgi:hypothetical protein